MGPILELEITTYLMDRAEGEIAQLLAVQIHSLRDQLEHIERTIKKSVSSKRLQKNHGKDFILEFDDCAPLLVGLSESMRRTGTVPSDKRARKHGERRRRRRHTADQSSTGSSDSLPTSTSGSSQQTASSTDCSSVQTMPILTVQMSRSHHVPPIPQFPSFPRSRQTPQSPRMTEIAQAPEATQTPTSDRYIDIGSSIGGGWIKDPGEPNAPPHKINSIMDPRVPDNYISFVRAEELRLQIKELEQDDAHHPSQSTETNNRAGRVIGKVSGIEWRQKRNSKPIMVDFWVTTLHPSRMNEQLVFGTEFEKRLQRIAGMER
ncbi:hypothetical protein FVEN_g4935 [Fusarium venenatum]|nr:hypothetical protein FVEN_g4935 [Fusarium venenatum]